MKNPIKDSKIKLPYNHKSAQSIVEYGEKLLGHSLKELHPEAKIFKGKGGLGDSVEYYHYGYEPNSKPEPDFDEAGIELKCTPLKLLKDKSMASKERLVLNIMKKQTNNLKPVVFGIRTNFFY